MRDNKLFTTAAIAALVAAAQFAAPASHAETDKPLKIGVPTAMSGPYGVLLNEVKRSVEFAAAQANAKGGVDGHKVLIQYMDTEAKPEAARRQAEKLALDGYNILIGAITSGEGLAMAPMLERWNAVYVNTFAKSTKLTGDSCSPRLFRANQSDPFDMAVVKPWLDTRKEKKWAVIGADVVWGREVSENFEEAAAADGRQVSAPLFSPLGTTDFAPFIQQIKSGQPEGVFVTLSGRDSINFLSQAAQFGLLDKVVMAGVSINLESNLKAVGAAMKGVWGNINYSASIDTPQNRQFVADWAKMYNGDTPTDLEGENYVGMQVILEAVEKAHSVKPADVARALSGGTFDTVFGNVLIRAEDHQMVLPNYFGVVEETNGTLHNIVKLTVAADKATPPADPACKMPKM